MHSQNDSVSKTSKVPTPQSQGEKSISGHMPNPESDDSVAEFVDDARLKQSELGEVVNTSILKNES